MTAAAASAEPHAPEAGAPFRVLIVGAGFGGLFATQALRTAPVEITLIDQRNHHLFQPLLYQVATGILSAGTIAPPIRDILRRQGNTRVVLGEATGVDLDAREVTIVDVDGLPRPLGYDSLIVATGAMTSYFGHDRFSIEAPGMKSIDDALELRSRIFGAFEHAEVETDPDRRRAWLTFVVVGGGPTGVEMAGQIEELSRRALDRNFRTIDPATARVVLLDAGPSLLAAFAPRLRRATARSLARLGVEVHLDSLVTDVDHDGIAFRKGDEVQRIEARTKIWAAGVAASPFAAVVGRAAGVVVDRAGRVEVEPDCSLSGHPEVFVIGDAMSLHNLPGVAQVAIQAGRHCAATIERRLSGEPSEPFHYRDKGSMATISRFRAIAQIGPLRLTGFVGWVLWLGVHLVSLTGFKNRVATLANWTAAFLGRGRAQRVITQQQVVGREAIARERARREDGGRGTGTAGVDGGDERS